MKIAPKSADAFLAAPGASYRAALLYGPDAGLVRERAKRITQSVLESHDDPFALTELPESKLLSDPALLPDEIAAISILSPKRVLVISDASDKLTRLLEDVAPSLHAGVFVTVMAGDLGKRSSLRSWFETESFCACLACYHDEERDVRELLRDSLEKAGIASDRDTVEYLAQRMGNDRYVTRQEIEKLMLYAWESKRLTLDEAQALVDYNRETGFDELVNAVADRNLAALEASLALLTREGLQPVGWLRALQRYFNRLYLLRAQMDAGRSAEQVIQSIRPPVFFKQVPLLNHHLSLWNSAQLIKALRLLAAAELACKTSQLPPIPASSRRLLQITQIR